MSDVSQTAARNTLLCSLLLLFGSTATATTINVPGDSPTIQSALDSAGPGDIVQVAPGTYVENIVWPTVNGIQLVGAGPALTTIDGNRAASVIRFETANVIDDATLVEGFTIRNGFSQPPWPASHGGGIYLFYADPILRDLWIVDNEADDFGGGVYNWAADPTLIRCVIARNTAISRGGFECFGGAPHFDHVTVVGNTPGGIHFDTRGAPLIENSTIAFNNDYGIQLHGQYPQETLVDLAYTDIYGGIVLVGVSELNDLGGNIVADPSFVNHEFENYELLEESVCIDAADPAYPLDSDGTRSDMGAFPFAQLTTEIGSFAGSSSELDLKLAAGPNPFVRSTIFSYALPVPATVTVTVYDPAGRTVRVLVDGVSQPTGARTVAWDGRDTSGRQVASGIYFYRVEAGEMAETRSVVLVR